MNKRIELTEATIDNNQLILKPASLPTGLENLVAKGQMLVDSDQLAFIYILETADEFVYAGLPHTVWTKLKEANDKQLNVILKINNQEIELVELFDELNYLLENIKGNANYGEEMENKVVELFSI
jgi:Leucine-rich repeat (LRR) protein